MKAKLGAKFLHVQTKLIFMLNTLHLASPDLGNGLFNYNSITYVPSETWNLKQVGSWQRERQTCKDIIHVHVFKLEVH